MDIENASDAVKKAMKVQERSPSTENILLKNNKAKFFIVANNIFAN